MTPPEGKASAEDQTNEYTKTPQVDDDIEEAKDDEIIEVEDDVGAPSASNNKQMSSPEEEVKFSKLSSKEEDDDNNNDTKIEPEKEPEEAPTPRIRMTVAADAPIYLRLWEGRFKLYSILLENLAFDDFALFIGRLLLSRLVFKHFPSHVKKIMRERG